MQKLWYDLAYGFRMLMKNPRFTAAAVLSLAIGIGANTTIFSVTNALFLRPLPYNDAERLVILWNRSPGLHVEQDWFSPGQYLDIKAENQVFENVAATIDSSFNLTSQGVAERVEGARVSSSLFGVLGAQTILGRVFTPDEDEQGRPTTAILSYGFWQRHFAGDPNVVGKTLSLNGNSVDIVGVMPRDFTLNKEVMPTVNKISNAEILLSLPMGWGKRTTRTNEDYNIFGRMKPGVTVAQAQADVDRIVSGMKQQYPDNYPPSSGFMISVVPLLQQVVGEVRRPLLILLGAVGFVLLIACANVANLQLARAAVRQREIAIRAAVGAGRRRIVRQLLTESILLALIGGVLGLFLTSVGLKLLVSVGPDTLPRLNEIAIDGRVLSFTFLVSLITGIVFGLAPAVRSSRIDLNGVLKDSGRSTGPGHTRARNAFVVVQVALSLVLLIGAGLLVRSYKTVIVNEKLAERFWPNQDPIGKRLERGDKEPWRTVVGVVRDTKDFSFDNEPPISIYHPHEQFPIGTMFFVVRSSSPTSVLTSSITKELRELDPELPAFEFKSMEQRLSDTLARRRFSTFLLGVFSVVALVLAAIGIYGVMAYSVTQRTQEIGIRMALGAEPGKIMMMIVRHSFVLVIGGVVIGLGGAFALTRVMSSLLFRVSATDTLTFVAPPLILGAVAFVASYFPARRAARVDPTVALRSE